MAVSTTERPSRSRAIPVRRLDLDLGEAEVPRWMVDDDPVLSHLVATLSAVFPRGEEFFVATVRANRDAVGDDEILRAQVKAFIGQEAMHGREHRVINERLDALGYHTEDADDGIAPVLAVILRLRPRTLPLAVTAASELFTGILAEAALGHEPTRKLLFGHPAIETLVAWHALEELEHKNVAFDVLERTEGGYAVRMAGLAVAGVGLGGYVAVATTRAVLADARRLRPRHARNLLRNLGRQRVLSRRALGHLLAYLSPSFHPDDMDTDDLVNEWRARVADTTTVTAGMPLGAEAMVSGL